MQYHTYMYVYITIHNKTYKVHSNALFALQQSVGVRE